ncbi:MAG: type sorting protein [Sphingobacteriales bacterium]|nr:type sorting protein [Sphingobacteriales bacterium]
MKTAVQNHLGLKLSLASVVLVCSVFTAFAQERKEIKRDIIIRNGDTLINGKKLSEVDNAEREKLRKELHSLERSRVKEQGDIVIRRKGLDGKETIEKDVIIKRDNSIPGLDEKEMKVMEFRFKEPMFEKQVSRFNGDSLLQEGSLLSDVKIRIEGPVRFENRTIARNGEGGLERRPFLGGEPADFLIDRRGIEYRRHPENSQVFNYNSTDRDGISTRVSFRIREVEESQLKKITGSVTVNKIEEVKDLTLYPNFSSGKTTLSFQLPVKGSAGVKILDSSLKVLYSDKVSGDSFSKQLSLPKNGVYYLSINQNKNWFVRQIVKE